MKIGVILEHFEYFLKFSEGGWGQKYYCCTIHQKYLSRDIKDLAFCDWRDSREWPSDLTEGDWTEYFKSAIRLNLLPQGVSFAKVARLYEVFFKAFFEKYSIEVLVCGGTTGFERCGLAVAKRLGIKTLCTWEGFFRPNTISFDVEGMNAESAFSKLNYSQIMSGGLSDESLAFVDNYLGALGKKRAVPLSLRRMQGSKFSLSHQVRSRWKDRNDLERVRLPFSQHAQARLSYSTYKKKYAQLSDVSKPFIFFPLQTHTDSNIAINGDLVPYALYVGMVISAFKSMRPQLNCDLLIKEHPFDVFRYAYNRNAGDGVLWLSPETPVSEIILSDNCLGTVVVNSTAGFESLLLGKPVVTMGRSMFSHKELVEIPLSIDVENIARSLLNLVGRKVNPHEVREFAAHFFDRTQLIGNLEDSPTKEEIVRFEQLLNKMVKG